MREGFDEKGRFVIEDYNTVKSFSSFLPGIAGKYGVPLWCFYVNRGQCVSSMGIQDKNHSILEFFPANKAYQEVFNKGFRTFIKTPSDFYEPFSYPEDSDKVKQVMKIHPSYLQIEEMNHNFGLSIKVTYYTLPSHKVSALIRDLKITNFSKKEKNIKILDGVPCVVPFGANHFLIKNMSRTLEAWMDSYVKSNTALFKLRVSPADVAHTHYIKGANFYASFIESSNRLKQLFPLIERSQVFNEDVGLGVPHGFLGQKAKLDFKKGFPGKIPAAFSYFNKKLRPNASVKMVSFLGASSKEEDAVKFVRKVNKRKTASIYDKNKKIIDKIQDKAFVASGLPDFDNYIKQSYLDNVLRGGFPQEFIHNKRRFVKYLYSRKHGDLERDYNDFRIEKSYYSCGEGNFRDMNQNRRCDNFFSPFVGNENIKLFFNLQRADGYNPLKVKPYKFIFTSRRVFNNSFKDMLSQSVLKELWSNLCSSSFYLGDFVRFLEDKKIPHSKLEECIVLVLDKAKKEEAADFGDGFWVDHWTYNLDLIQSYLSIFPDKEKKLLFENEYSFYDDAWKIKPRKQRFILKDNQAVPAHFLFFDKEKDRELKHRNKFPHRLRFKNDNKIIYTNLITKILVLILNKVSSLDPFGKGIEAEGGKPGWCDAMNGLPALNGSSFPETLELKRLCEFLKAKVKSYEKESLTLPIEIYDFLESLKDILSKPENKNHKDYFEFWDKASSLKERYREKVFRGFRKSEKKISLKQVGVFLDKVIDKLDNSFRNIKRTQNIPTYFINKVTAFKKDSAGNIIPLKFKQRTLPLFLEGFARGSKVLEKENVLKLYQSLKKGPLYDKKLKMFKVNASLKDEPLEIGRIRVFKPGWLENESIWLHMEYKYILELIKNDLYPQFYKELFNCLVCFSDPAVYGRNVAENSSFIASSAYPDKDCHGQGFVARLTGSTVEVLNMFTVMAVGKQPFFQKGGNLFLKFSPVLKKDFFTRKKESIQTFIDGKKKKFIVPADSFCFKFLGDTLVTYYNPSRKNTYDAEVQVEKIKINYKNGQQEEFCSESIPSPHSKRVRNKEAEYIEVHFK